MTKEEKQTNDFASAITEAMIPVFEEYIIKPKKKKFTNLMVLNSLTLAIRRILLWSLLPNPSDFKLFLEYISKCLMIPVNYMLDVEEEWFKKLKQRK